MALTKTYNAKSVVVVIAGIPIQGFAKGSFVKVKLNADIVEQEIGAHGDSVRTISQDLSGTIEIMLQQTSPSNAALTALVLRDRPLDREAQAGLGAGPSIVEDLNGTILASTDYSWVKTLPEADYSEKAGNRTWIIECAELRLLHGGAVI